MGGDTGSGEKGEWTRRAEGGRGGRRAEGGFEARGEKKISFARYHCVCPVGRDRDAGFINTVVFGGIIA